MSKADGQLIAIKFTDEITSDISACHVGAFSVTGNEYNYVPNGALASTSYALLRLSRRGTFTEQYTKETPAAATASSEYNASFASGYAIDGNASTRWASLNKTGTQYLQIDLGSAKSVGKIRLMTQTGYVPLAFDVQLSTNGTDFTTVGTGTATTALTFVDVIFTAASARYVRFVMVSTASASFYDVNEAEVYSFESIFTPTEGTDDTEIMLTVEPNDRFNSVVGNLTVAYNSTIGNLAGSGGPVASFSQAFAPADLVAKPHQNDQEHIAITSVTANGTLTAIQYLSAKADEHISITGITAVGVLTNINDI
jgi:hypothetical protein